mmetsp:Transcript_9649/g.23740  ORF Transcript_9649/g.23740 Transcript_9649/m.23740 type:complete len:1036 (-) Transcript_9649:528-3635(-)
MEQASSTATAVMEAREWELDHSYIRCGGFFQCTRRTFEVVVLILSWWVIAGVIVIEYKYINAQEFAFFLTGMTNTFAGGILLAIFCGGRLCSAYGTSPRRSPERFELDEDDGFRGPNPRLSGGGEFRVPIDDSDIVLPQQGHVVTSSCEHHLQDRGRGPEGSDEGNRKAKASSRGNTTTALSFSLPISNFESFLLIILGILNGIEYGILNKALMILPIATRQMLGSSSTLFQMVFAFLWRLPPAITPKLMLCGGVLMLGGVLQGLQTFVVHNEASSVGLGGAKVAVSGGDSAGALGSSSSSSSSAGGSSGSVASGSGGGNRNKGVLDGSAYSTAGDEEVALPTGGKAPSMLSSTVGSSAKRGNGQGRGKTSKSGAGTTGAENTGGGAPAPAVAEPPASPYVDAEVNLAELKSPGAAHLTTALRGLELRDRASYLKEPSNENNADEQLRVFSETVGFFPELEFATSLGGNSNSGGMQEEQLPARSTLPIHDQRSLLTTDPSDIMRWGTSAASSSLAVSGGVGRGPEINHASFFKTPTALSPAPSSPSTTSSSTSGEGGTIDSALALQPGGPAVFTSRTLTAGLSDEEAPAPGSLTQWLDRGNIVAAEVADQNPNTSTSPEEPGLKRARATEQADASLRTTSASSSITTDGDESQSSDSAPESDSLYSSNAGFLLQIFAMLLSSNKGCLMQHVLQRTPGIARLDKVALGSRTMIYSGITCLVLSLVTEAQKHDVWKVVADTGLILKLFGIASILCVMVCAELRLLQITSTVTFGVFGLLHSIPIVLSGVLLFGDTVGLFDGLGFLVCLAGSYWYMLLVKGAGKDDALPPAGREKDPGSRGKGVENKDLEGDHEQAPGFSSSSRRRPWQDEEDPRIAALGGSGSFFDHEAVLHHKNANNGGLLTGGTGETAKFAGATSRSRKLDEGRTPHLLDHQQDAETFVIEDEEESAKELELQGPPAPARGHHGKPPKQETYTRGQAENLQVDRQLHKNATTPVKNNNPPEGGEVTLTSPLEEWRRKPRYARLKNDEDYNSINVL